MCTLDTNEFICNALLSQNLEIKQENIKQIKQRSEIIEYLSFTNTQCPIINNLPNNILLNLDKEKFCYHNALVFNTFIIGIELQKQTNKQLNYLNLLQDLQIFVNKKMIYPTDMHQNAINSSRMRIYDFIKNYLLNKLQYLISETCNYTLLIKLMMHISICNVFYKNLMLVFH